MTINKYSWCKKSLSFVLNSGSIFSNCKKKINYDFTEELMESPLLHLIKTNKFIYSHFCL